MFSALGMWVVMVSVVPVRHVVHVRRSFLYLFGNHVRGQQQSLRLGCRMERQSARGGDVMKSERGVELLRLRFAGGRGVVESGSVGFA